MKRQNGMERLPSAIGSTATPLPLQAADESGFGKMVGPVGAIGGPVGGVASTVLYVDVVKNMPKPEAVVPARPTAQSSPEFSIFQEDFPALPGTATVGNSARITTNSSQESTSASTASPLSSEDNKSVTSLESSSGSNMSLKQVTSNPNTNMVVNEDQEKEIAVSVITNQSNKNSPESTPPPPPSSPASASEALPQLYDISPHVGRRYAVSQIFDKQFINVGVRQRALNGMAKRPSIGSFATCPAPPGFESAKMYARLRTNDEGMPLGGVKLDKMPPPPPPDSASSSSTDASSSSASSSAFSSSMLDSFGLLGLATTLGYASQNPNMFGDDAYRLNIDKHCCASSASSFNLHSAFAGPLLGGRCPPHETTNDVPNNYRFTDRLTLQQPKIHQMQVELLFFFFYTYPGDMMQMLAAAELAERNWRYHKYERLWLKRQPDNPNYIYRGQQEAGEYNYFNMVQWKVLPRHFNLDPEHIERTITKTELLEQYGYHPQMSFY
ncbi:uncharacterized protein Dwil_GK18132 [Drosophila willistoni]|uniref:NOT2/NOT3/NOT5 C-terminal domain-containing protein n=1 Tax=Drosophila willistoni TaxID=7260 RepID=B4MZ84_DROWI|nr:uncharacterized protein Dwil_GK18132 [Drosophila willistoni]